jgi:hypothetical protein
MTIPLDYLPIWLLIATITLGILLAIEAGFRLGKYRCRVAEPENPGPVGTIVGATLGLLAFMLAFTFGLVASRFEQRCQIVVEEANAIGTTFLRAGFLPEQQVANARKLLKEYVDSRLEVARTGNVEQALSDAAELHRNLWEHAERAGQAQPTSQTVSLFIEALNETIDVHSERVLVGVRSRLPLVLWIALLLLTIFSMAGVGYHEALAKSKRSPATLALVLSFMIVLTLIIDLDRPREGLITVNQEAMATLKKSMDQSN